VSELPVPGLPAKAWAMDNHSWATGPVTSSARSSGCRRWVTSRQKSSAGPRTEKFLGIYTEAPSAKGASV